jgi:type 1 glutamine amidotransferase
MQGGWEGHEPLVVADLLANLLREEGFITHIFDTLDSFCDESLMDNGLG